MCGRYSLSLDATALRKKLGCMDEPALKPRYNIAPGQDAPVIVTQDRPRVVSMRWGLVPSWAKDDELSGLLVNARAETLAERPAFSAAFERRRCLVLADGYYEWVGNASAKQPVRIVRRDRQPFTFAGLSDRWRKPDGLDLLTFTIITTEANVLLRVVQSRMPVILDECHSDRWLDPKLTATRVLRAFLRPSPSEALAFYPVDRIVNSPHYDFLACIAPYPLRRPAAQPQPGQFVRIEHCPHGYELPEGLEPGTLVRLVAWQTGQWKVEFQGQHWDVPMTNVDAGDECFVAGEWRHESHPLVRSAIARLAKWKR